jgi:hypothetical protein
MTFTTGTASRCAGGNHYEIPVTVNGVTETLQFKKAEIDDLDIDNKEEFRQVVARRLKSAILEANATTLPQQSAAISNKTFKV